MNSTRQYLFLICCISVFFIANLMPSSTDNIAYADAVREHLVPLLSMSTATSTETETYSSRIKCIRHAVSIRKNQLTIAKDKKDTSIKDIRMTRSQSLHEKATSFETDVHNLKRVRAESIKKGENTVDRRVARQDIKHAQDTYSHEEAIKHADFENLKNSISLTYKEYIVETKQIYAKEKKDAWNTFVASRATCPIK